MASYRKKFLILLKRLLTGKNEEATDVQLPELCDSWRMNSLTIVALANR